MRRCGLALVRVLLQVVCKPRQTAVIGERKVYSARLDQVNVISKYDSIMFVGQVKDKAANRQEFNP